MDKVSFIGNIVTGECDDYLTEIAEAVKTRRDRVTAAKSFRPGDSVRLGGGLKPNYLNGLVVTVGKVNTKTIVVSFPTGAEYGRFSGSRNVRVPKSCCETVEVGEDYDVG